ncbi:MAG TPA: isoleucine--tRNA ligase [Methanoregulaceae archaeon]|nr:MAG: isoleucine--tRNA ligase [Methanolinea sp.]HON81442.1 isoleucine--tRNA ligase [Methanoregulaceae archaeon]HPD10030.1 isoleucine--tRNA ligase [Methanoregulaceae archaeon]HRT15036.1 isoleucine--tRNA ligase [Methanoregulaceae archaeon]HRU30607.1 isoleucine--tRNA ligase [Methanoregulaceae archaeon]
MKEAASTYSAREIEDAIQKFWEESAVYRKTKDLHAADEDFFFVDGPPYTTGHIHLGTAWNKIIKDCILRFTRMTGRNVIARAGYDMHGLPIEVRVEQQLGFSSKKDIERFGIGPFIDRCREFAAKNMAIMSRQFQDLGVWLDFDDPYQTMHPGYIEAAWWTLKKADEAGMLERGHRVVNWCPRCATAIADAEVEYWDESDPSIFVKFPVTGRENEYLVIWTTTPWTLPANVAVAVHPDITYARVEAIKGGRREILWIADELVEPVLRKGRYQDYSVLEKAGGSHLTSLTFYSPLEEQIPLQKEISHRVVTADFVTLENTGMVHIAPGHGWDDYLLACRENLPIICPVDSTGRFQEEAGEIAGTFIKAADPVVLDYLGDYLLARETVVHRYGHCWRCKTPIIFRATEQWFLKASELRDRMLDEVAEVTWYPEWAGSARFYDWIKEARDWCISRQRYWGIPIPIWECRSCGRTRVFGTVRELEEASGSLLPDPHRPYVDEIPVPCTCGGSMRRVEDIFDVWFDSAVASWATLGFPAQTEAFDRLWPADFITEGQDQTRGWFYSQLGASTIAFGRCPYRSVLMHGFALDAEGRKMSKSLGNVVTPEEVVASQGVDVLRLYVLSSSAPWDDLKFNWDGVKTVNRAMNIFWNVYRFPLPYMILDGFSPAAGVDGAWDPSGVAMRLNRMAPEDRWILSRINSCAAEVDNALQERQLHRATRMLISFILEDLSRWYVQLVRERMWLEGESAEKTDAYETITYVLRRLCGLMAPFTPHITEQMYQNLKLPGDPESIHMTAWFPGNRDLVDERLEQEMAAVRSFDEAQANARQAGHRKLRWPVAECVVVTGDDAVARAIEDLNTICRDRANARRVRVLKNSYDRSGWRAEPVMKALGPAFGKKGPLVRELIAATDAARLKAAHDRGEQVVLRHDSETFSIVPGMVTFVEELPPGIFQAPMDGGKVYVDTTLSPELEAEGYAREIIRRIQEMRRQLDLRVEDYITAAAAITDERVAGLVGDLWKEGIGEQVRAAALSITARDGNADLPGFELSREWDVEGIPVVIAISQFRKEPGKE